MSNAKANFYANLLFKVLSKLSHQIPVAFYPGYDSMHLDFSKFKNSKKNQKYEIYKDIMENDALLVDINYINKVLITVNKEKFFFITYEKYAQVENNINKIGS